MILVGLDVGTSGTKALAVRAEDGSVVATATHTYPLYTPAPGIAEQDGNDFADAAFATLTELARALGPARDAIAAIGLTGQMHSAMLLDADAKLVRRAILWCDTRTHAECDEITRAVGIDGLRGTVCNLALEGFTLPKLLWLRRHEPETFARVCTVVMPKDWVGAQLTDVVSTDVSDASGTLAFDPRRRVVSTEILRAVNIDPALFPRAEESATVLGTLTRSAAERTGLRAGLPVVRGAADNAAGAVGVGVVREGRAMVSIGTSGVVLAHTNTLRVDERLRLHAFCAAVPMQSYVMGVMLAAGGALRWFRDAIAGRDYDAITAAASRAPRGSRGVVFLPYLMGERTPHNDADARGAFVGLSAACGFDDLARAVLEGITYGLADSLALVRAVDPPVNVTELRVTGGGARSASWRQLLADVFGTTVATTSSTEGPAFGAAIIAGAAIGVWPSVDAGADRWVRVVERCEPDAGAHAFYAEARRAFASWYPRAART